MEIVIVFGSIFATIITTIGVVIVASLNRTRQHAKNASDNTAQTREQVVNSHSMNLRDDLDEKFQSIANLIGGVTADIGGIRSDIRTIHREQGEDRRALATERDRIRLLEDTVTPTQIRDLRTDRKETP